MTVPARRWARPGRPPIHWGQVRVSRDGRRVAATVWSSGEWWNRNLDLRCEGRETGASRFLPEVASQAEYGRPMERASRSGDPRRVWWSASRDSGSGAGGAALKSS